MDPAITEQTVLHRGAEGASRGFSSRNSGAWRCPIWLFVAGSAALLWVALYNRYPLVNPDSANYLLTSITHRVIAPYRSPIYSVFIQATNFHTTPWLVIFAQSMFSVFVLYLVFDCLAPSDLDARARTGWFAALIAFLSLGSSLPWMASEIMPDLFTGFLLLALFPLLFDNNLGPWRRAILSGIVGLCVGVHLSHLAILLILLPAILAALYLGRDSRGFGVLWKRVAGWALIPAMVAVLGIATLNWTGGVGFTVSPGGNSLLLGRLFTSGLAQDYLHGHCRSESYVACRHLDSLPKDQYELLFGGPLLQEMGGWRAPEVTRLVLATVRAYPGRFLLDCVRQTGMQFVSLGSDDPVILQAGRDWLWITQVILAQYPGDRTAFFDSEQNRGSLLRMASRISPLHVAVFWLCLGANLLLCLRTRQAPQVRLLFWFTLLLLLANAFLTGALSAVTPRYQSRVEWVVPFCFVISLIHWLAGQHPGAAAERQEEARGAELE